MQGQKKIKSILFIQPWRIFILEVFLFLITLGFGIISAFKLRKLLKIEKVSISPVSFWQFIFYFLLATLFILAISFFGKRFKKGREILFKGIFVFTVIWGGIILFSLWLPDLFALILVIILVFSWLKKPIVLLHNLVIIFGIAGIGSILGLSINSEIMLLLLIIFSIYDYIAVYKTKHMVKMAKEMIEAGAILGFILPQKFSDLLADLKEVKPGGRFLILGGGDVAFPLLFCVSLLPSGILNSLVVGFHAFIGLLFSFVLFVSQKEREPIPALPPIALFSIIGFLIAKLIL